MPPAVIGAGIAAGATLGGAALSSSANKSASKAQQQSAEQALAFERDKEARRQKEWDTQQAAYQNQWNAWNAARLGMMKRYGLSAPSGGGGLTLGHLVGAESTGATPSAPVAAAPAGVAPMAAPTPSPVSQPQSLADLWNWNQMQGA